MYPKEYLENITSMSHLEQLHARRGDLLNDAYEASTHDEAKMERIMLEVKLVTRQIKALEAIIGTPASL